MIRCFNCNSRNKKNRAKHNKSQCRHNNINNSLCKQIFRTCHIPTNCKHRQMKHVHMTCTTHDNVTDTRNHKHIDTVFNTILQDNVAIMAMYTACKYRFNAVQHRKIFQAIFSTERQNNIIFTIKTIFANQLFKSPPYIINNSCSFCGKCCIVTMMCQISPQKCK